MLGRQEPARIRRRACRGTARAAETATWRLRRPAAAGLSGQKASISSSSVTGLPPRQTRRRTSRTATRRVHCASPTTQAPRRNSKAPKRRNASGGASRRKRSAAARRRQPRLDPESPSKSDSRAIALGVAGGHRRQQRRPAYAGHWMAGEGPQRRTARAAPPPPLRPRPPDPGPRAPGPATAAAPHAAIPGAAHGEPGRRPLLTCSGERGHRAALVALLVAAARRGPRSGARRRRPGRLDRPGWASTRARARLRLPGPHQNGRQHRGAPHPIEPGPVALQLALGARSAADPPRVPRRAPPRGPREWLRAPRSGGQPLRPHAGEFRFGTGDVARAHQQAGDPDRGARSQATPPGRSGEPGRDRGLRARAPPWSSPRSSWIANLKSSAYGSRPKGSARSNAAMGLVDVNERVVEAAAGQLERSSPRRWATGRGASPRRGRQTRGRAGPGPRRSGPDRRARWLPGHRRPEP